MHAWATHEFVKHAGLPYHNSFQVSSLWPLSFVGFANTLRRKCWRVAVSGLSSGELLGIDIWYLFTTVTDQHVCACSFLCIGVCACSLPWLELTNSWCTFSRSWTKGSYWKTWTVRTMAVDDPNINYPVSASHNHDFFYSRLEVCDFFWLHGWEQAWIMSSLLKISRICEPVLRCVRFVCRGIEIVETRDASRPPTRQNEFFLPGARKALGQTWWVVGLTKWRMYITAANRHKTLQKKYGDQIWGSFETSGCTFRRLGG